MSNKKYISKRERVVTLLNDLLDQIEDIDRAQFYFLCLTRFGASKGVADSVLEVFSNAGVISVGDQAIKKINRKNNDLVDGENDVEEK